MRSALQRIDREATLFELPPTQRRSDPRTGKNNIRAKETPAQRCVRLYLEARSTQTANHVDLPWPRFRDPIDGELIYFVPLILAALRDVERVAQRVLRKNREIARARIFAAISKESRLSCDLDRLFSEVRAADQADIRKLALLLRISPPNDPLLVVHEQVDTVVQICPIGHQRS